MSLGINLLQISMFNCNTIMQSKCKFLNRLIATLTYHQYINSSKRGFQQYSIISWWSVLLMEETGERSKDGLTTRVYCISYFPLERNLRIHLLLLVTILVE
jgi:hypothetical protein